MPRPVHPRVCGEQALAAAGVICHYGSSPRVRGTGLPGWPDWRLKRFIPACAGNRLIRSRAQRRASVHPRVCGEQAPHRAHAHARFGSSPRVRGTGASSCPRPRAFRFIPACAGNSLKMTSTSDADTVHPRVCGEQASCCSRIGSDGGSSPRVRGTDHRRVPHKTIDRFIPACAGNRGHHRISAQPLPVHPRVCGEQNPFYNVTPLLTGSSPRVRGTDYKTRHAVAATRFIPACAGNRLRNVPKQASGAVHPRVCGEQLFT